MSRYIPCEKMKKLREAAKNGDERAKKILRAQLSDEEDFSADLEDYFNPKQVVEEPQEEVKEAVNEETNQEIENSAETNLANEDINDISKSILNLISACDKKTIEIANDSNLSEATKKGALSILGEIKQSCLDNLEKFGKLMSSIAKKEEEL